MKKLITITVSSLDGSYKPIRELTTKHLVLKKCNYNEIEKLVGKSTKEMYYKLNKQEKHE